MASPKTPTGTETPYCTAVRLFVYHDAEQCADMLRDGDDPRPTRGAMLDPDSDPGAMLLTFGLAACGELESAALVGKRYSVLDLQRLAAQDPDATPPDNSMAARGRLEKVVADLWFWLLAQRRQPASADPEKVPGAKSALLALEQLAAGETIFGFTESADAGLPAVAAANTDWPAVTGPQGADRLFGSHGPGRATGPRRWGGC